MITLYDARLIVRKRRSVFHKTRKTTLTTTTITTKTTTTTRTTKTPTTTDKFGILSLPVGLLNDEFVL